MIIPLVYELGNLVGTVLEQSSCDECRSALSFSYAERVDEFLWVVYAKCPNGCFGEDEYNLFKIEQTHGG